MVVTDISSGLKPIKEGKYIVIEGNEGAGKTTQCQVITDWLSTTLHLRVINVREPGGDPFGEALRRVIKNPDYTHEADEELLVFSAARMGMRRRIVLPALKLGNYVISDRSELSTLVYQGFAGGIPIGEIADIQKEVAKICRPDLFIILDISSSQSRQRVVSRGEAKDSFESRDEIYQRRVSDGYRDVGRIARDLGYNVVNVDGMMPQTEVSEVIKDVIANQFFRPVD